mmetsp:Transcript_63231/g.121814  ORF Transcript_63231/g.121814 Transcript_63231/m.121814 type:complete len:123 (+) Transcript_63231:779-1147(+)|eukprot:CAMPEP_0172837588 /NCGR_PEP_ID=MMETSP1075-20121228/27307_1 /TAXON_ID=2916 /ORGANISM="Ceratium fusus, Strain PA161109" /LENGTH=122 /DNA_ID=CAMNT_0013680997 /DNA_START=303 /DNA_END=671 /DNA_ORIENTATION=+
MGGTMHLFKMSQLPFRLQHVVFSLAFAAAVSAAPVSLYDPFVSVRIQSLVTVAFRNKYGNAVINGVWNTSMFLGNHEGLANLIVVIIMTNIIVIISAKVMFRGAFTVYSFQMEASRKPISVL